MIKKSLIPIIVLFSVAIGFFIGNTVYKSENIFYSQNKDFLKLKTLINIVEDNYSDKINVFDFLRKKLIEEVSIIDPYSSFYDEDEYEDFKNKIKGEFTGVGIRYITINDTVRILEVIKNSPAEKSGIKNLDAIIAINGENITSMSLDSIVNIFKTKEIISLTAIDFISNKEKTIKLEKDIIQINPITYFYLDSNIAYIKISSFQKNTFEFFKKAEEDLLKNHSIEKVILDLRSNGGGMLKSAVNIVDEFIEKGDTIVSTQSNAKNKKTYISTKKGDFKNVELIVLVNYSTASAAELVTLAFQDNDRALIFGTRTFGKGVFQQDLPVLNNNIAHITTGKYFGPSGRNINITDAKDSLKVFKTKNGRIVYGNKAISPDIFCDSINYNSSVENFDAYFIPMIDSSKKNILNWIENGELEKNVKKINSSNNNTYLNYIATNINYFETLKYLVITKFMFEQHVYQKLLLDYDYCFLRALNILKTEDIKNRISGQDTIKPVIY